MASGSNIVVVDFEFAEDSIGWPIVRCLCYQDMATGEMVKLWADELTSSAPAAFTDPDTVLVTFAAKAELSCFRVLGWEFPDRVIDLFFMFKRVVNGDPNASGANLLSALSYYGLGHGFSSEEKHYYQMLAAQADKEYTPEERQQILDYCAEDVTATVQLYQAMQGECEHINVLHWGAFAKAQTYIEMEGIPVDRPRYECIQQNKDQLQRDAAGSLVSDPKYAGVYVFDEKTNVYKFSVAGFAAFVNREKIPWPRLRKTGVIDTSDETLKDQSELYPIVEPIRQTRKLISALRGLSKPLYADDCLRTYISPFHTATGRNNPSSKEFIPAMPRALRQLMRPLKDEALIYLDYGQQEILICAAMSGDQALMDTYRSDDPYVYFGHQSGVLLPHENKKNSPDKRNACKVFMLAVTYRMAAESLALAINAEVPSLNYTKFDADYLIYQHKNLYATYWEWSDRYILTELIEGFAYTAAGWSTMIAPKRQSKRPQDPKKINLRSVGNHPIQGTGSDILRNASIHLTRDHIRVCGLVHDAVIVRCHIDEVDGITARTKRIMIDAAEEVLQCGVPIRVDDHPVSYPNRWAEDMDSPKTSGAALWRHIEQNYFGPRGI